MNSPNLMISSPTSDAALAVKHIPVVVLSKSECLHVVGADGQPLLDIAYTNDGPCIRLAREQIRFDCSGELNLAAASISLQASEDVTIQGRTIRLN